MYNRTLEFLLIPLFLIVFSTTYTEFHTKLSPDQERVMMKIYNKAPGYGISPDFAVNLAFAESSFREDVSVKESKNRRSYGPMQILTTTGRCMGYSLEEIRDPDKNIEIGLEYLAVIKYKFYGKEIPDVAVAATYNHGIGNMMKKLKNGNLYYKDLPKRTQRYLTNIFRESFDRNFMILEGKNE